jgi:hypothetical protein
LYGGRNNANGERSRDDHIGSASRIQVFGKRPSHGVRVETLEVLARPDVASLRVEEDLTSFLHNRNHYDCRINGEFRQPTYKQRCEL